MGAAISLQKNKKQTTRVNTVRQAAGGASSSLMDQEIKSVEAPGRVTESVGGKRWGLPLIFFNHFPLHTSITPQFF
jgi:hypothetical protein